MAYSCVGHPCGCAFQTQLAYESAKWVRRVELVGALSHIAGGHGGYLEDQGYEWYARIYS